jgi:hypothetical protein
VTGEDDTARFDSRQYNSDSLKKGKYCFSGDVEAVDDVAIDDDDAVRTQCVTEPSDSDTVYRRIVPQDSGG